VEQELKLSHTCAMIRDRMDQGGLAAVEDSIEERPWRSYRSFTKNYRRMKLWAGALLRRFAGIADCPDKQAAAL
jgi:hypothetical protein